jgi:hypothetical protein
VTDRREDPVMPDASGPPPNPGFSLGLGVLGIVAIAAIVAMTIWG